MVLSEATMVHGGIRCNRCRKPTDPGAHDGSIAPPPPPLAMPAGPHAAGVASLPHHGMSSLHHHGSHHHHHHHHGIQPMVPAPSSHGHGHGHGSVSSLSMHDGMMIDTAVPPPDPPALISHPTDTMQGSEGGGAMLLSPPAPLSTLQGSEDGTGLLQDPHMQVRRGFRHPSPLPSPSTHTHTHTDGGFSCTHVCASCDSTCWGVKTLPLGL